MKDGRIVIARLWSRYDGRVPSRAGVIKRLNPDRFKTICVYLMKNSNEPNLFEQNGYKVFYLSSKKFLRLLNISVIYKLVKILKDEQVDIIHCHRHQATSYGNIAAMLAGRPAVIAHVHGIGRTKNLGRKVANRVWMKRSNRILTVSEAVKEDVLRDNPFLDREKVTSIGNSIDYEHFADVLLSKAQAKERLQLPRDSFLFGTVARMAPNKGQIYLIRAFAKVKKTLPAAHLIFIGDGRLRGELERQALDAVPDGSIHFSGYRQNVAEILKAMDAFVLSSIGSEGLPRVLLEAMTAGVPCIGTQVSGIPEIIEDGWNGHLVPPGDDNALADAMLKLRKVPKEQFNAVVKNARQKVRTCYAHNVVVKKLQSIYETEAGHCCEDNRR